MFYGADEIGMIRWQAQLRSEKGGMGHGGRDVKPARDALQKLCIKDKHDRIDLDVLRAFGDYARHNWGIGAPNFDRVKAHLMTLFPKKFGRSLCYQKLSEAE